MKLYADTSVRRSLQIAGDLALVAWVWVWVVVAGKVHAATLELAGTFGYSEVELLEKWARDSKILDIFEGTQQIQQLIIARRILGLSSTELK